MSLSRRKFVKLGGGTIVSFFVGGASKAETITEFATLESDLIYEIEHGRPNPINIVEGIPGLPPYPPTETEVEWGNLIIK